jgi:hypothetical protein
MEYIKKKVLGTKTTHCLKSEASQHCIEGKFWKNVTLNIYVREPNSYTLSVRYDNSIDDYSICQIYMNNEDIKQLRNVLNNILESENV